MMGPEASGFWFFTQPTCRRLPPCVIFHAGGDQTVIRAVSEDRPDHPEVDHLAGLGLSGDGRSVNRHLPAETKLGHAHYDLVARQRAAVREASGGRLGYLHMPDMMAQGWAEFHRDLYTEFQRAGLIV